MDFSLTSLFVVPVGQSALPSSGSTQNLTPGQVGFFRPDYTIANAGNIAAANYFYVAQGRTNNYLEGSKRSDKIKGGTTGNANVTEWYKVTGCATARNQITDITGFNVTCGEVVTLTLRAFSSYIDTLYFNGFTRSVTVQAPCCDCGADPCDTVDENALINQLIDKLNQHADGLNGDNINFDTFYTFENIGGTTLRITGKPLTAYGQPCDVAAFPFEYDRMWFRAFIYSGPATTADFIVDDSCNEVATATVVQRATYPKGTSEEIAQLEKNFYSYQVGYLKTLYRMAGYNPNFESWVTPGTLYDTYYIKFNEFSKSAYQWGDYIHQDSTVIIATPNGSAIDTAISAVLVAGLGTPVDASGTCLTTTTTTSTSSTTTTSTTTLIP